MTVALAEESAAPKAPFQICSRSAWCLICDSDPVAPSSSWETAGLSGETGEAAIGTPLNKPRNDLLLIGLDLPRNFNEKSTRWLARKNERSRKWLTSRGSVVVGPVQFGYGQLFAENSILTQGRNGTAWEEPGCAFLKTSFSF